MTDLPTLITIIALGIAIEHGYDQAAEVAKLLEGHAFHDIGAITDLAGHLRVTQARK